MTQKVLSITSNIGVEHDELIQPLHFLQSKGIECIHAAIEASDIRTVKMDSDSAASYPPDVDLDHVHYDDYDLLIIPAVQLMPIYYTNIPKLSKLSKVLATKPNQ